MDSASFANGSEPPLCGARHFAQQNLDAGRIQFARADGRKGSPNGIAVWEAEQNAAKAAIEKLKG